VFTPRLGHLHAGCAKDITITFKSTEPRIVKREIYNCHLTKIHFEQSINDVKDWDDRMKQVRWVNEMAPLPASQNQPNVATTAPSNAALPQQTNINVNTSNNLNNSLMNLNDSINMATTTTAAGGQSSLGNHNQTQNQNSLSIQTPGRQIIRKKIVEVETEPKHVKSDEPMQNLDLFLSVNCDYSKYRCKTNAIRFKDTLMFQTRVYE
jgi:hypothetical protein